jgi:hypothetical protein
MSTMSRPFSPKGYLNNTAYRTCEAARQKDSGTAAMDSHAAKKPTGEATSNRSEAHTRNVPAPCREATALQLRADATPDDRQINDRDERGDECVRNQWNAGNVPRAD